MLPSGECHVTSCDHLLVIVCFVVFSQLKNWCWKCFRPSLHTLRLLKRAFKKVISFSTFLSPSSLLLPLSPLLSPSLHVLPSPLPSFPPRSPSPLTDQCACTLIFSPGALIYLLNLFCNSQNPTVREETASLLAKMITDKLVGPKVRIALSKFLPLIFMDAMRDNSEASVHMFESEFCIMNRVIVM